MERLEPGRNARNPAALFNTYVKLKRRLLACGLADVCT